MKSSHREGCTFARKRSNQATCLVPAPVTLLNDLHQLHSGSNVLRERILRMTGRHLFFQGLDVYCICLFGSVAFDLRLVGCV